MRCRAVRLLKSFMAEPGGHHQRVVAEVVAVGEGDGPAALLGGLDRRGPDVEAVRRHLCEQPGEIRADETDLKTELAGDRPQQLVVEPAVLAGGGDADVGRSAREGADGQHPRRAQTQGVDVHRTQRLDAGRGVLVGPAHGATMGQFLRQHGRALRAGGRALVPVGRRGTGQRDRRRPPHHQQCRGQCEQLGKARGAPAHGQTHHCHRIDPAAARPGQRRFYSANDASAEIASPPVIT